MSRRRLWAVAGPLLLLGLLGATFAIGRWSAPLGTQPDPVPSVSTLTTPLELRQLSRVVPFNGTVQADDVATVPLLSATGAERAVVTKLGPKKGAEVAAGDVLVEISGRPVIALAGARPAYRSLKTEDTGKDVGQLQKALNALGHKLKVTNRFDWATGMAVRKLYSSHGYTAHVSGSTTSLPLEEVAYVSRLPAVVGEVPVQVGDDPTGKAITLIGTTAHVVASLRAADSAATPEGAPVTFSCGSTSFEGVMGGSIAATVSAKDSDTDADSDTTSTNALRAVTVNDEAIPASLTGSGCSGTATVAVTSEPVLVAPASAIYTAADGTSIVRVALPEAVVESVPVDVGSTAGGWVELLRPDARLGTGTQVVIGAQ